MVVKEAQNEFTWAANAPENSLQKANSGINQRLPNKSTGLSTRSCVTFQVHEAFPRAIFTPQQGTV